MANWISEAVFYHIYTLGFCGAPLENDETLPVTNRINKVKEWIPHLLKMGINAVYFGPLFESVSHGYDTNDYYKVDRRLGTNEDLKEVIEALHASGIRVVLDGVFNHVGRDFWAFKDLKQNGRNSKYINWFCNVNFDGNSSYGDGFWYEGWEGHFNLVKLNLRNPEVIDHLLGAAGMWMDEFKIDGLRLDVAYCMDKDFLKRLKDYCLSKNPEFWLMGEMIHGDYNTLAGPNLLHSATNYECYKGNYSSHNDKNYFEINYSLNRLFGQGGIYKDLMLYNFVDNHDVNRIGSILKERRNLKNVYTLMFTMPGIPSIYYGSEWGIEGEKANGSDAAIRPCIDLKEMEGKEEELVAHIGNLAQIKKEQKALQFGLYEQVVVKNKQLVFARSYGDETVYVLLNLDDQDENISFRVKRNDRTLKDLLEKGKEYTTNNGEINIVLPSFTSQVLLL